MSDNEHHGYDQRPGEVAAKIDPAHDANDASLIFIGSIRTPWSTRAQCPKNIHEARELKESAFIQLDQTWRAGLNGLKKNQHAIVLYWMDKARRDLIVQFPRHKLEKRGVFALRSPARPNPIALGTVRILDIDHSTGCVTIDAIDCLDQTKLIDIKPWHKDIDTPLDE